MKWTLLLLVLAGVSAALAQTNNCTASTCNSLGYQCLAAPISDGCGGQIATNTCAIGSCLDYCQVMYGVANGVCTAGTHLCDCSGTVTTTTTIVTTPAASAPAPTPTIASMLVNACTPLTCAQLQSAFVCIPAGHIDQCTGQVIDPASCVSAGLRTCTQQCNNATNSTCNANGQACTCGNGTGKVNITLAPPPNVTVLYANGTSTLGVGMIVGIAVGGGAALFILLVLAYVIWSVHQGGNPVNQLSKAPVPYYGRRQQMAGKATTTSLRW